MIVLSFVMFVLGVPMLLVFSSIPLLFYPNPLETIFIIVIILFMFVYFSKK